MSGNRFKGELEGGGRWEPREGGRGRETVYGYVNAASQIHEITSPQVERTARPEKVDFFVLPFKNCAFTAVGSVCEGGGKKKCLDPDD